IAQAPREVERQARGHRAVRRQHRLADLAQGADRGAVSGRSGRGGQYHVLMIACDDVSLSYDGVREAVSGLTLAVGAGSIFELAQKRTSLIRALSRGMRQRLGVAKTLMHDPKVLLLDEPASALDPGARAKLRDALLRLKARGLAIVISSHILPDLAGLADAV